MVRLIRHGATLVEKIARLCSSSELLALGWVHSVTILGTVVLLLIVILAILG